MSRAAATQTWLIALVMCSTLRADTFTYLDDDKQIAVEARLAGEGQGAFALELADGELRLIPQGAVQKREPGEDPEPVKPEEIVARMKERFGGELFRGIAEGQYAIGLILAEPLPKQYENRSGIFLKKAAKFFKSVEGVFLGFMKDMKTETEPPRYPQTILIFETDDAFEKFTREERGERGLSAGNIAGYYSMLTNHLVIRMSECHTFATPLHEAIHQQVYNRGVLQRLAPLPAWYNEGIATGFEGNTERIGIGPLRVSRRYALQALAARSVNWNDVILDDAAFRGDIFAGEAYGHGWGLHWLLATKYKKEYTKYVELLREKKTLAPNNPAERRREFEEIFGKTPSELQSEFPETVQAIAQKQKVNLLAEKPPGYSQTLSNLAEVEMTAIQDGPSGVLQVEGRMKNVNTIRPMAFYVTVQTEVGTYAEWYVKEVGINKTTPLPKQIVQRVMQNARGGPSRTFRVRVKAAVPDGPTGEAWERGDLPRPMFGGG